LNVLAPYAKHDACSQIIKLLAGIYLCLKHAIVLSHIMHRVPIFWKVRENQGKSGNSKATRKSGNFRLTGTNFSTVQLVVNGGLTAIGINKSMMQYVRGSHGRYTEAWF
jgi:hypothetical protein